MRREIVTCDICKEDSDTALNKSVPVVFTTEQTEGYPTKPYVTAVKVDICGDCEVYMADNREFLTAAGAQGNNRYWFKSKEENANRQKA